MSVIYKVGDQQIFPGKSWIEPIDEDEEVQHPPNWNIWSDEEKAERGITKIELQTPPDSRLYDWSHNDDGSVESSAKPLDEVKASLSTRIKEQQFLLLSKTDWAVVRKADTDEAVPSNIADWRAAIRTQGDNKQDAITGAADVDALADLLTSGLFDWPEME